MLHWIDVEVTAMIDGKEVPVEAQSVNEGQYDGSPGLVYAGRGRLHKVLKDGVEAEFKEPEKTYHFWRSDKKVKKAK